MGNMATNRKNSSGAANRWPAILVVAFTLLVGALFGPSVAHAQLGSLTCSSALFGSVGSALSSNVPVADSQVRSNTTAVKNIDCTWKGIAWQLAHTVLHSLTGSVVNWINSGFQGSPAFLTNPEGYFANLGDQLTGAFISDTGILAGLCSPFNIDIRLALALGQGGQTNPYTCTLGSIINNVQNSTINGMSIGGFMGGDFSQGGWPAFIALAEPQNNEAGAYLQAHSDLLARIGAKQGQVQQQLLQGNGFLSWQSCNDITSSIAGGGSVTPQYINQTLGLSNAQYATLQKNVVGTYNTGNGTSIQQTADATGEHYSQCTTETPGSIINSSLAKTLGASADELNLTNDINQIVSALFSQLLSKTLQGGLFSASHSSSSGSNLGSLTQQLINDQQAQTNSSALQGQAAGEVQSGAAGAQQAVAYRTQILTAITAEQVLYQTTRACIYNELNVATSSAASNGQGGSNGQGRFFNGLTNLFSPRLSTSYLQSQLSSIDTAIAGINHQISDAATNLQTASSSVALYQSIADQIQNAPSLSSATDLSNQYSAQLSTVPYNAAADPGAAYSDLNSTIGGIATLETARTPYQATCNGQQSGN